MKKRDVDKAWLEDLRERMEDLSSDIRGCSESIQKNIGWDADVDAPHTYALQAASLAASASDLARTMLVVLAQAEDRKRIEAELRARSAAEGRS